MTAIAPRRPSQIIMWVVIGFGAVSLIIGAVFGVLWYQAEQQRIGNLHTALTEDRAAANRAAAEQQKLLGNYTTLYNQVITNGDKPNAPAPSTIQVEPGAPGAAGQNATDVQVQSAVTIYCDLRLDCQGPTGLTGQNGTNGADGATGAQGPPGATGATGADGQPPFSWTQPGVLPGTTETCTRTDPFDASAPTYQCS